MSEKILKKHMEAHLKNLNDGYEQLKSIVITRPAKHDIIDISSLNKSSSEVMTYDYQELYHFMDDDVLNSSLVAKIGNKNMFAIGIHASQGLS